MIHMCFRGRTTPFSVPFQNTEFKWRMRLAHMASFVSINEMIFHSDLSVSLYIYSYQRIQGELNICVFPGMCALFSISSQGLVTKCEKLIAADFILMIFMPQEQPRHKHLYAEIESNARKKRKLVSCLQHVTSNDNVVDRDLLKALLPSANSRAKISL